MGSSPGGRKESDTTERPTLALMEHREEIGRSGSEVRLTQKAWEARKSALSSSKKDQQGPGALSLFSGDSAPESHSV